MDVGFNMAPNALNPTGTYPTSRPAGDYSDDWTSPVCSFDGGTSGIFGGCIYPANQTRSFAYDQATPRGLLDLRSEVSTHFDGRFNFPPRQLREASGNGDYYVVEHPLDLVGSKVCRPRPPYPTMFDALAAAWRHLR